MSIERETLDQLLGGDLDLAIIRRLYPDDQTFCRSLHVLLRNRDVRLIDEVGIDVPQWKWRELFIEGSVTEKLSQLKLSLTDIGARKIA